MKILIVSGFLGAGKTTFIAEMSRRCKERFVVMENEMGAVGVDGGLLSSSSSDIKVWELTEGCICCTMKTDFATSVLTIESALTPEFLVVEPTGVGMLSRIIENIRSIEYERIEILSPITILDARHARETARDFPEVFTDQLASAGVVVLSKTEGMSADEREAAAELVRDAAPNAEIISSPYAEQSAEWWSSLWRRDLGGEIRRAPEDADAGLESVGFSSASIAHPGAMAAFLERAIRGAYGRVVRAKGIVPFVADGARAALRFDIVDGSYSITDIESSEEPKAVFIGRALETDALRRELAATIVEPEDHHDHEHDHSHHHDHEHEDHDHKHDHSHSHKHEHHDH